MWDSKEGLVDTCLEETGGLGVDIIVDSGGLSSLLKLLCEFWDGRNCSLLSVILKIFSKQ